VSVQHHFAVRYPDIAAFPREYDEKIRVHGLHLKTQKAVQIGEAVAIQFRFPQREQPLLGTGVVGWVAAETDANGKRSMIVRHLELDAPSLEVLELVRSTPPVEPAELGDQTDTAPPPAQTAAPPPPPPPPPAEPVSETAPAPEPEAASGPPRKPKRVGRWLALAVLLLLGVGLGWFFGFGGDRVVALRFLDPPPVPQVTAPDVLSPQPEPALPKPQKPKPKPRRVVPPAVATSFDFFQRPAQNEFIVTFNRPIGPVETERVQSPLMEIFRVARARTELEKAQYFLPYDLVRTVTFEEEGGSLKMIFVAQNSQYLPTPVWERRGRELVVKFIAQD